MKYSVKQIDGEWCVVDKDTDDIVADATDRKDAVLQASALNREESNSESKPKFHRGSSYGNKPEAELSEGPVSDGIDKAIDLMYELTDDGQMAKNAYHEAKAKFKLGRTEAEVVLDIWNDSHKSDRRNFIEVETINELSKKTLGSYVKKATTNVSDKNFIAGHRRGMLSGMGKGDGRDRHGDDLMGKADKRKKSINLAVNKLTKESEEINELSKDSLRSYRDKSSLDSVDAWSKGDDKRVLKRQMGQAKASMRISGVTPKSINKLTKESEEMEIDEAGRTPKEVDEVAVRELVLYAENDADLYRQSALPIIANLQRKVKKGTYDAELAIKLWRYHADRAAKKYIQEFDGEFSPATRNAAAKEFRDGYDEEVQSVLDESSIEEANGKEQLTPELAKGILNDLEIDSESDFFTLSSSKVSELLDVAKQYGYKKSKNAPGSTARMFLQYIQRLAKKAKGESSIEEANGKEQLTPELAKGILNDLEIEGKDFFTLSSSKVHELLDVAKQYGYKKSKNAPGSTARMFHQYIQRLAKKAKGEEINELSKDTLGSYVKKAAFDNGMAGFRQGKAVGDAGKYHKRPDNATANAEAKRGERRMKGIDRAVKKLTNESQEEINESFSKLTDKQLQDKFIELKVKAKDLSKDSKESKQLQKIRDEIKKRKDSPKQEIKESLSLEDTIISIIKS